MVLYSGLKFRDMHLESPLRVCLIPITIARQREYIVWKMREAHFPHYILPLASAAGASTQGERAKLLSIRHALRLKRKFAILKGMLRDE